jgi:hypothetical protein
MADTRINSGAPQAGTTTSSGGAKPATQASTPAPAPAADNGRILPRNWAQSLQVAATRGQEVLKEGFDQVTGRQPQPPPGQALQLRQNALFGSVPPAPDMANLRIENPSNPQSFPQPRTMFDLANISMSAYGGGSVYDLAVLGCRRSSGDQDVSDARDQARRID